MRLWRISNHADLSGEGGIRANGRWHQRGRAVVYLAEHPALALLETIVHLEIDPEDLPKKYQLLAIEVPEEISIEELKEKVLDAQHPVWHNSLTITQTIASSWFSEARSLLLRVPSVILPESANFLFNPSHHDARKAKIISTISADSDERLFTILQVPKSAAL
jgi:RES domain-containing protein